MTYTEAVTNFVIIQCQALLFHQNSPGQVIYHPARHLFQSRHKIQENLCRV